MFVHHPHGVDGFVRPTLLDAAVLFASVLTRQWHVFWKPSSLACDGWRVSIPGRV
jgi:hypothetical protein